MSDLRKTLTIYALIWLACVALALGGMLWFGPDARVPVEMSADGVVLKSRSIAALWLMPGMVTLMYGALALAGWAEVARRRRRLPVELGADALRGLQTYGRTVRNGMIGFGLLALLLEMFGVLRMGGMAAPLGLDREGVVRLFNAVAGVLFAYLGNVTPKLPWTRLPGVDPSLHQRAHRVTGWVLVLCGIGYTLSALLLPFATMVRASGVLLAAMIGLPLAYYVFTAISCARGRQGTREK